MSIAILGNAIKCRNDKKFGRIVRQDVSDKDVLIKFHCDTCGNDYDCKFSLNQYIRIAQAGLIDPPEIKDFQKKMIIIKGELPRIDKGLDGAFIVDQKKRDLFNALGVALLCKCNKFFSLTPGKFKKDKMELLEYCAVCTPKSRKIEISLKNILIAGQAGLIEPEIFSKIRAEYDDTIKGFNTKESYTGQDGTLSTWVQEELGMIGESKGKKCYICGCSVAEGSDRCPKCGSDL